MVIRLLPFLLTVGAVLGAPKSPTCRYIPGDAGWPSQEKWNKLNKTLEGRLIATVPIAHVCHDRGDFFAYNETECAAVAKGIEDAGAATLYVIANGRITMMGG